MAGVTTAIVGFILVCFIFPHVVRNRPQFYAAFGAVLGIILLDSLAHIIGHGGFSNFAYAIIGMCQIAAIILLFLCVGGLTWKELAGDMGRAFEVIRRGEEEKEIIIPLSNQPPRPKPDPDAPRERIELDDSKPESKAGNSSLPIE